VRRLVRVAGPDRVDGTPIGVLLYQTETVVMHPPSTSHRSMDAAALTAAGIGPGLVRISCGVEHPDDLWSDIEQALDKAL
jgi:methionine-gamma-lyase